MDNEREVKNIDMTGRTCSECGKGKYAETSITDDWDGVLHCTLCGYKVVRWRPIAINFGVIKSITSVSTARKYVKGVENRENAKIKKAFDTKVKQRLTNLVKEAHAISKILESLNEMADSANEKAANSILDAYDMLYKLDIPSSSNMERSAELKMDVVYNATKDVAHQLLSTADTVKELLTDYRRAK